MPRPKSGLLSRMMRLAPATCLPGSPAEQPRFCIRPGAHYLVGIHVLNAPGTSTAYDAWRLKLHSSMGQAMALSLNKAQPGNGISHASAEWDPGHLLPAASAAGDDTSGAEATQHADLQAEIGLGKLHAPNDPSDRWTMRIAVQIARSDRYVLHITIYQMLLQHALRASSCFKLATAPSVGWKSHKQAPTTCTTSGAVDTPYK